MGIETHVYYLSKKYHEVEYETSPFIINGKTYIVPSRFHVILKEPTPYREFRQTYRRFAYIFKDGERYYWHKDEDELVHDFWIFSDAFDVSRRHSNKIKLLLPSIKTKKGCLIKFHIMSNTNTRRYFLYIERNERYFEPDTEYYFITTYT